MPYLFNDSTLEQFLLNPLDDIIYQLVQKDFDLILTYLEKSEHIRFTGPTTQVMFALFILEAEGR